MYLIHFFWGSRRIAREENCPPTQTLTAGGGGGGGVNFTGGGNCPDTTYLVYEKLNAGM